MAAAPVLHGEGDDVGRRRVLVRSAPRRLAWRRAMLPENPGQARRPEAWNLPLTGSRQARRRAGLSGLPKRSAKPHPAGSAPPASGPTPPCAAAPSPSGLHRWRHDGSILPALSQPPHLVGLQPTDLPAPAATGERRHADRAHRLGHRPALRRQHVHPARSLDTTSSGLCSFRRILRPPTGPNARSRENQFSGGRPTHYLQEPTRKGAYAASTWR